MRAIENGEHNNPPLRTCICCQVVSGLPGKTALRIQWGNSEVAAAAAVVERIGGVGAVNEAGSVVRNAVAVAAGGVDVGGVGVEDAVAAAAVGVGVGIVVDVAVVSDAGGASGANGQGGVGTTVGVAGVAVGRRAEVGIGDGEGADVDGDVGGVVGVAVVVVVVVVVVVGVGVDGATSGGILAVAATTFDDGIGVGGTSDVVDVGGDVGNAISIAAVIVVGVCCG